MALNHQLHHSGEGLRCVSPASPKYYHESGQTTSMTFWSISLCYVHRDSSKIGICISLPRLDVQSVPPVALILECQSCFFSLGLLSPTLPPLLSKGAAYKGQKNQISCVNKLTSVYLQVTVSFLHKNRIEAEIFEDRRLKHFKFQSLGFGDVVANGSVNANGPQFAWVWVYTRDHSLWRNLNFLGMA